MAQFSTTEGPVRLWFAGALIRSSLLIAGLASVAGRGRGNGGGERATVGPNDLPPKLRWIHKTSNIFQEKKKKVHPRPWRRAARDSKASNVFPETSCASLPSVPEWSFLTNHARVLLCIAHDPGARLRDIAASLGITERSAHGLVTDLTKAGYVVKHRDGRRNRYQIQAHLPLPEPASQAPAIGEVLALLLGNKDGRSEAPGSARP